MKIGKISVNNSYALPYIDGESSNILSTDGSGSVSWIAPSGSSGGGGLSWSIISKDTNADSGNGYLIDATYGNIILTLPAGPSEGDEVGVCDYTHSASGSYDITVARNSSKIIGAEEDLEVDIAGAGFNLVYGNSDRGWEIVSEISGGGSSATGSVVQVSNYQRQDPVTVTGQIPLDTSKPQITEGTEVLTLAHTPKSATNKLRIDVTTNTDADGSQQTTVALFKVGTNDALACSEHYALTNYPITQTFTYFMTAGVITELTFKVRMGCPSGNSFLNRQGLGAYLDGTIISSLTITEIQG